MRWQFIDKITDIAEWSSIEAVKAVSFEEYQLYVPLGRQGVFPESLLIESCTEVIRYLVVFSSHRKTTALLSEVRNFKIDKPVQKGSCLILSAQVKKRNNEFVYAECTINCEKQVVATGQLTCRLDPLDEYIDPIYMSEKMREVYGTS